MDYDNWKLQTPPRSGKPLGIDLEKNRKTGFSNAAIEHMNRITKLNEEADKDYKNKENGKI